MERVRRHRGRGGEIVVWMYCVREETILEKGERKENLALSVN